MSERYRTFEDFWPYYVREHGKKATRSMHFAGTTAAAACLVAAAVTRRPGLVGVALVAGYGPAWISHFFIENNRPATFTYPLWSLRGDLRMWRMIASGTMDGEVERLKREATVRDVEASSPDGAPTADPSANSAAAGQPDPSLN
jgi:hypothetical protein